MILNEIKALYNLNDLYFLKHLSILLKCISQGTILATDRDTVNQLKEIVTNGESKLYKPL